MDRKRNKRSECLNINYDNLIPGIKQVRYGTITGYNPHALMYMHGANSELSILISNELDGQLTEYEILEFKDAESLAFYLFIDDKSKDYAIGWDGGINFVNAFVEVNDVDPSIDYCNEVFLN